MILIYICQGDNRLVLLIVIFSYILAGKRSEFLKTRYNIEYTQEDIFWNGSIIDSELKVKGIILDTNQKLNISLEHKE